MGVDKQYVAVNSYGKTGSSPKIVEIYRGPSLEKAKSKAGWKFQEMLSRGYELPGGARGWMPL